MGADYRAISVIGIILPDKDELPKAKISVRKKAFQHTYEDGTVFEFDPKTGQKLFIDDEKEEIETNYPAILYDINSEDPEINQTVLKAPAGLDFHYGTDCMNICLGYGSSNGEDSAIKFKAIPDIEAIKTTLQELLEPLGLWDEKKFGLYTILYCSY
jgi:hypothetical protein